MVAIVYGIGIIFSSVSIDILFSFKLLLSFNAPMEQVFSRVLFSLISFREGTASCFKESLRVQDVGRGSLDQNT